MALRALNSTHYAIQMDHSKVDDQKQVKIRQILFGGWKPDCVSLPGPMICISMACQGRNLKFGTHQLNRVGLPRWAVQYMCDIHNFALTEKIVFQYNDVSDEFIIKRFKE